MSNAIVNFEEERSAQIKKFFKDQITSDSEMELFCNICTKNELDPFMRQIYPMQRRSKQPDGSWKTTMTITVGIDGLRSIADRTGNYAPGKETSYSYDNQGNVVSATAYVKKRTPDGHWHEVSACAYMAEYKPERGNQFWDNKPHIMLGKCAESLALRKAFPTQMSSLYTKEELDADTGLVEVKRNNPPVTKPVIEVDLNKEAEKISPIHAMELIDLIGDNENILNRILKSYNIEALYDLQEKDFEPIKKGIAILKKKSGELDEYSERSGTE